MKNKLNRFNYLYSDIQFGEFLLIYFVLSSLLSTSRLKFVFLCVCVCVCVCVCEDFSLVFAPLIKVSVLSNQQAFETNICFKEDDDDDDDDDRIHARTHTRLADSKNRYTHQAKLFKRL